MITGVPINIDDTILAELRACCITTHEYLQASLAFHSENKKSNFLLKKMVTANTTAINNLYSAIRDIRQQQLRGKKDIKN